MQLYRVTNADTVRTAVSHFAEHTDGRVNVLLNNAGNSENRCFPIEEHYRPVDVNIKGVMNCAHLAFPLLKNTANA